VEWDFVYCVKIFGVSKTGNLGVQKTRKMKANFLTEEKKSSYTQRQNFTRATGSAGFSTCNSDRYFVGTEVRGS
jgi:hypothetical protein